MGGTGDTMSRKRWIKRALAGLLALGSGRRVQAATVPGAGRLHGRRDEQPAAGPRDRPHDAILPERGGPARRPGRPTVLDPTARPG